MKRILIFFVPFLLIGNVQSSSAEMQKGKSSSEAIVEDLYKHQKSSPFFQTRNHGLVDKYFTKKLSQLIWNDAVSSKGEVGALDFNPIYDAQDYEIKNLSIRQLKGDNDKAEVAVSFENFGVKVDIIYSVILTKHGWRIDNIKYSNGRTLLGILSWK